MPDMDLGGIALPGLCGCGHDEAYHYRPSFKRAEDGSMVVADQTACANCRCPQFDVRRTSRYGGLGELAGKEYPDGGKH